MAFQITNILGKPIPIKELDKEAAYFMGVRLHPKNYASPRAPKDLQEQQEMDEFAAISLGNKMKVMNYITPFNWFDCIAYWGQCADAPEQPTWSWIKDYVLNNIWEGNLLPELQTLFDLVDRWESKGYKYVKK